MFSFLLQSISWDGFFRRSRGGFFAFFLSFAVLFFLAVSSSPLFSSDSGRAALLALPILSFLFGFASAQDLSGGRGAAKHLAIGIISALAVASVFHAIASLGDPFWTSAAFSWKAISLFLLSSPPSLWLSSAAFGFFWALGNLSLSFGETQASRVFTIRAVLPETAAPFDAQSMLSRSFASLPARKWAASETTDSMGALSRSGPVLLIAEPVLPEEPQDSEDPSDIHSREWILATVWDPGWRVWAGLQFFSPAANPRALSRRLAQSLSESGEFARVDILS